MFFAFCFYVNIQLYLCGMCYFALKGPCLSASCRISYILHDLHVDISFALLLFFTFCLVLLMLMSSLKLIDTQKSISERYKNIKRRINISVILYESLIDPIFFYLFVLLNSILHSSSIESVLHN